MMLSKNDAKLLSIAIEHILMHLMEINVTWKALVMVDKCKIEWKALSANGLTFILYEFHFLKEIEKFSRGFNDKATAYEKVIAIQRATSKKELKIAFLGMQSFCIASEQEPAWLKFEKNWLCEKWINGWTSIGWIFPEMGLATLIMLARVGLKHSFEFT